MGLFVGAYAAAPSLVHWDPVEEEAYLRRVLSVPGVRGLEVPWPGFPGAYDLAWVAQTTPASSGLVITDIGHTIHSLRGNPVYGLASEDAAGRALAVADVARLRDDVQRIAEESGRPRVTAVELHSAPLATAGSASGLRASLTEIAAWDWSGADVVIEHCDTLRSGQDPEKGYLSLDAELEATRGLVGLSINWGRSAIELRDPDAVPAQIAHAATHGLLRGLVFSGVSAHANAYGPAWQDNHPPFAPEEPGAYGEPSSLLTSRRAAEALDAAGDVDWVAVKMGYQPLSAPIDEKLRMISHAVETVNGLLRH